MCGTRSSRTSNRAVWFRSSRCDRRSTKVTTMSSSVLGVGWSSMLLKSSARRENNVRVAAEVQQRTNQSFGQIAFGSPFRLRSKHYRGAVLHGFSLPLSSSSPRFRMPASRLIKLEKMDFGFVSHQYPCIPANGTKAEFTSHDPSTRIAQSSTNSPDPSKTAPLPTHIKSAAPSEVWMWKHTRLERAR